MKIQCINGPKHDEFVDVDYPPPPILRFAQPPELDLIWPPNEIVDVKDQLKVITYRYVKHGNIYLYES